MKTLSKTNRISVSFALPVLFLAAAFLLPLFFVFINIDLKELFSTPDESYLGKIIFFTLHQAFFSALFSTLLAFPGAYVLSHYSFPGKKILTGILTVPFILPGILVVLGFILVFGNNGYLNNLLHSLSNNSEPTLNILYSYKAIILAHVFYNFPVAIRLISSSWTVIPGHWEEAARTLGAGKIRIFRRIIFPQLMPSVLASFFLIFLYCFMSFIIVLVLGGGPEYSTIEVEIYRQVKSAVNYTAASRLALMESFISFSILSAYIYFESKVPRFTENKALFSYKSIKQLANKGFWIIYFLIVILLIISPMFAVIVKSFSVKISRSTEVLFSLKNYIQLFSPTRSRFGSGIHWSMISTSLFIAICTLLITTGNSILISSWLFHNKNKYKSGIELLFILPMGISSLITGLGYLLFSRGLADSDFVRFILIILAHSLGSFPLVFRSIKNHYSTLDFALIEASRTLGSDKRKTFFKIEIPLIKTGIRTGAIFAMALSLGEINATLLLSDGKIKTIPIVIYQLIGSYNFAGACVLGTVLIIFCVSVFWFVDTWKE